MPAAAPLEGLRPPPRSGLLREALRLLFGRIIRVYFRSVDATGNVPAEDTRGRLFVANHVNALVDPILVLTSAPCPISPIGKSTLWKIPVLRWLLDIALAVPIVRKRDDPTKGSGSNEEVFDRIADALKGGQNILIFPEGTSHDEPHLLELKTGAARMLTRAKARGGRGLTYQAVALEFEERETFRSRCLMLYGPVRAVDEVDGEGEALVTAITATAAADLSELLVEGATWPERRLIARVAEMLANDTGDRSLARWNSIGRQVEAATKALRSGDGATITEVSEAVERYYAELAREGLADAQLANAQLANAQLADAQLADGGAASGRALRAVGLILLLPLALIGVILYALPYPLPRLIAGKTAKTGDEVSTFKLGAGLVVHALWASALGVAAVALLPRPLAAVAVAVILISPFAALAWLDISPEVRRSLRVILRGGRIVALQRARAEVMARIAEARARVPA